MSQYRIGVVVGSLRRESFNRRLAQALTTMAPEKLSMRILQIGDLPLYNQDDDSHPAD
ncbi:MAG TPA: NAD(P)H-dependent oxidoreductase, partial [Burkholderiaceae bacterium]|nr:NAD(P)H-dependent oxidoreductase [Burkholderiaceae bacterium]